MKLTKEDYMRLPKERLAELLAEMDDVKIEPIVIRKIIRIDEEMMDDPEAHPEWMEEQPFYEEMLRRFKEAKK